MREEIQRGFVLRRFEQYLGGGPAGLVVFSAIFGLGHLEQGYDVAIATARARRVLGRDLPAPAARSSRPMVGHAGFNLAQVAKFLMLAGLTGG